ncbi:hypothetical protein PsorP6_004971 [Peronosclerospora sorghi]|uniref:Uncharacterized protein n=1 Tax=Peronosclerospora sorghi TaxID=230839 RepID=A0ACC0W3K5_9STRA|nr:hypothetical protein PsorP6_004971 [Peronosclerospora sorghi]
MFQHQVVANGLMQRDLLNLADHFCYRAEVIEPCLHHLTLKFCESLYILVPAIRSLTYNAEDRVYPTVSYLLPKISKAAGGLACVVTVHKVLVGERSHAISISAECKEEAHGVVLGNGENFILKSILDEGQAFIRLATENTLSRQD